MSSDDSTGPVTRRRFLLAQVGGGAAALAASGLAFGQDLATAQAPPAAAAAPALPTIQLGPHRITRLISGGNPIGGFSHASPNASRHMLEYFTVERTAQYLLDLEKAGINAWQFDHMEKPVQALRLARERGSKLHFICIHNLSRGPLEKVVQEMDPIAILHHGGVTDRLFRDGKAGEVHDFVKRVHDMGRLSGVSSHSPQNIQRMADEGWEVDLFMTCFYYVTRPSDEQQKGLGKVAVYEPFYESDPLDMTAVIQKVPKPCLAFKILAAGRLCWSQKQVENAFQFAFSRIKRTDGVIVGMFPRYEDEIRLNAEYARRHGAV